MGPEGGAEFEGSAQLETARTQATHTATHGLQPIPFDASIKLAASRIMVGLLRNPSLAADSGVRSPFGCRFLCLMTVLQNKLWEYLRDPTHLFKHVVSAWVLTVAVAVGFICWKFIANQTDSAVDSLSWRMVGVVRVLAKEQVYGACFFERLIALSSRAEGRS